MRNPNGFGSVYKLSGKRRNPWAARVTRGFDDRGYPIYNFIGYYKTKSDAVIALAEYNKTPYNLDTRRITLSDLFNRYIENEDGFLKPSVLQQRRAAYNYVTDLSEVPYVQLRAHHMQATLTGATPSVQRLIKNLWSALDDTAMRLDIIEKRFSDLVRVTETYHAKEKQPFSAADIAQIWQHRGELAADIALVLLYTGCRAGEILSLRLDDIHLQERYLVTGSKTAAGKNRIIPIHSKIIPIIADHMQCSTTGHLFQSAKNIPLSYNNFFKTVWPTLPGELGKKYTPHAARHTLRSDLDRQGANKVAIDRILGHANGNTGDMVYTHKNIDDLLEAIEKISY